MAKRADLDIGCPADEAELRAYADLASQALFFPGASHDAWIARVGPENVRVARRDGQVVGGLVVLRMGQWFGGRSVPMAGIHMVGVAPEHRAGGVGSQLIRNVLEETHREGIPLSTLYPATQPVYRRPGFEQAGVRLTYRLPTSGIDPRDRTLAVREIQPSDHEAVRRAYTQRARSTSGNLDRSPWVWARILDPPPWRPRVYGYLVERDGRVEGYTVFALKEGDPLHETHELELVDLVVLTADAGRRLLTFFADHRSVAKNIIFCGAPAEPMLFLLAEQERTVIHRMDWMLRIVDVRGALEARGYPPGLEAEVHLDVVDDVLKHNHGRFVLQVADSHAGVRPGGSGSLRVDVCGLAVMYAGHLSPAELRATGHLDGPEEELARASLVFAGPAPWMPDLF